MGLEDFGVEIEQHITIVIRNGERGIIHGDCFYTEQRCMGCGEFWYGCHHCSKPENEWRDRHEADLYQKERGTIKGRES